MCMTTHCNTLQNISVHCKTLQHNTHMVQQ